MRPVLTFALLALLAVSPAEAKSAGLTVKAGETWLFSLSRGEPVRARRAKPTASLEPGQILVTVRSMMGTTMTINSNNPAGYTYRAELVGAGKSMPARSCTLPADGKMSFEHWPEKADAVRLSSFKPAPRNGTC
jgi:hypothetical protein